MLKGDVVVEKRFYLDGKCILSYDTDIYDDDEDIRTINELLIDPIRDEVYKKYYKMELIQQVLETVFKENDKIFQVYCNIKPLIENEKFATEDIADDDILLKRLMVEKLNVEDIRVLEKLLNEAKKIAVEKEMDILCNNDSMLEHFRVEYIR